MADYENSEKLHEECGVFGMYDLDGGEVASTIYYQLAIGVVDLTFRLENIPSLPLILNSIFLHSLHH